MELTIEEEALVLENRAKGLRQQAQNLRASQDADAPEYEKCPKCRRAVDFQEDRRCHLCGYYESDPQYD